MNEPVERKLIPGKAATAPIKLDTSEPAFRYALNNDAMATEKLAEGIRAFAVDAGKLESLISAAL
jgi:transaldolase